MKNGKRMEADPGSEWATSCEKATEAIQRQRSLGWIDDRVPTSQSQRLSAIETSAVVRSTMTLRTPLYERPGAKNEENNYCMYEEDSCYMYEENN